MVFKRHFVWWSCLVAAACLIQVRAQDKPVAPERIVPTSPTPQLPPLPRSPIEFFRQLLALSPGELEKVIAEKTESQRNFLKTKLAEYTALSPEDREARLRATELRWYLRPLMTLAPSNRVERLAGVPDTLRQIAEERLQQWDRLTPEAQKEVLENEWAVDYFVRFENSTPAQRDAMMNELPPAGRKKLETELARWRELPPQRRQQMCDRFQQFFELSPQEKEKTLNEVSEPERKAMENTLRAFEQLPPAQRSACISSFRKFASMTPEARAQFLKNAGRWKEMSSADRETWRRLVTQLPPLPPGFGEPPLPAPLQKQNKKAPPLPPLRGVATNAGG